MKVSIDKELQKVSQVNKEKNSLDPINEVKLLLEGESSEDSRILRGLSSNSQFNRIEKVRGEQIEFEKLENDYEGKVYKIEEIKKLCIDYSLRFLSSKLYTGSYDVEVAAKIKEFAKSTNSPIIDSWSLGARYFIMAPQELFALKDEKYISKAELRAQQDPAIFFQIDDNHYRLIHKWGSDFTIFRLIKGFRWRNWWSYQMFNTMIFMPFVTLLYFMYFDSPAARFDNLPIINFLSISSISFLSSFLFTSVRKQDEGKSIKGYFGETNWNSDKKIKKSYHFFHFLFNLV